VNSIPAFYQTLRFDLFWSVGTDLVHGWPTTWHGPVLPQGLEVETTGDRLEARVEVEIAKSEGVAWLCSGGGLAGCLGRNF